MADAGLIVLSALFHHIKRNENWYVIYCQKVSFLEVFVNTPLEICEQRDPKGLYKKARAGEIANFTGISSAYEAPTHPEIDLPAGEKSLDELVEQCIAELRARNILPKN
eukprot:TRINITY_DN12448_c0_g1_i1.p1 TRINITY_DN12448_c0_g1~~TRINITY_DN12448_c0_g1_i1.p1  ORF type:complete len:109 (-),score=9.57 TRINITY_DN12448_c0_g1_i1:28-354(-)